MKPVLMRIDMDAPTTGEDAYRAALASILDMELDEVPRYEGLSAVIQLSAWLASELNLVAYVPPQLVPPPGYWLARTQGLYGYRDNAQHTVVMLSLQIAHDPHPEQKLAFGGEQFTVDQGLLLMPLDPALPSGKHALG